MGKRYQQARKYSKVHESTEVSEEDQHRRVKGPPPTFSLRDAISEAREQANQRTQEKLKQWEMAQRMGTTAPKEARRNIPDTEDDGPWKKAFTNLKPKDQKTCTLPTIFNSTFSPSRIFQLIFLQGVGILDILRRIYA